MVASVGSIAVDLTSNVATFEKGFKAGAATVDRSTGAMTASLTRFDTGMAKATSTLGTFTRGLSSLAAIAGVTLGTGQVIEYADAWTRTQNSLKVAGLEGDNLRGVLAQLFQIAQKHGTGIESTVALYGKLSQSAKELGADEQELVKFTDDVAASIRVAGSSTAAAEGALSQLAQAMGGAKIQAQEFNSINDGARPILQAVADGIDEAGGSIAKLRELVVAGEITNREFFEGFQKGSSGLQAQAEQATGTVGQAFIRLRNSVTQFIGTLNESAQGTSSLNAALTDLSTALDESGASAIQWGKAIGAELARFITDVKTVIADVRALAEALGLIAPSAESMRAALAASTAATREDIAAVSQEIVAIELRIQTLQEKYGQASWFDEAMAQAHAELEAAKAHLAGLIQQLGNVKTQAMEASGALHRMAEDASMAALEAYKATQAVAAPKPGSLAPSGPNVINVSGQGISTLDGGGVAAPSAGGTSDAALVGPLNNIISVNKDGFSTLAQSTQATAQGTAATTQAVLKTQETQTTAAAQVQEAINKLNAEIAERMTTGEDFSQLSMAVSKYQEAIAFGISEQVVASGHLSDTMGLIGGDITTEQAATTSAVNATTQAVSGLASSFTSGFTALGEVIGTRIQSVLGEVIQSQTGAILNLLGQVITPAPGTEGGLQPTPSGDWWTAEGRYGPGDFGEPGGGFGSLADMGPQKILAPGWGYMSDPYLDDMATQIGGGGMFGTMMPLGGSGFQYPGSTSPTVVQQTFTQPADPRSVRQAAIDGVTAADRRRAQR